MDNQKYDGYKKDFDENEKKIAPLSFFFETNYIFQE